MAARGTTEQQRERAVKALELRIAGATYRQIGHQLDVSEKTAFYDVQGELGRLDGLKQDLAERLRDLELARIDRATLGLWPHVQQGDPRAVMAWTRIAERKAKLLGLDAVVPQQVDVTHRQYGWDRDDGGR